MDPQRIPDLKAEEYAHPLETRALERLKQTRGLGKVVSKFHEHSFEGSIRMQYTGSCMLASERTFPQLTYLAEKACDVLSCTQIPVLYLRRSDELQARTLGVEDPMLVLTSDMVEKLNAQELLFIIGREIAHIQHQHILYQEIGMIFPELIEAFSIVTLGLSSIISTGLRYALYHWAQMAEYTADRGGLLACQDENAAKWVMAKWAGLPESQWKSFHLQAFEDQARTFEGITPRTFDRIIGFVLGETNWSIARMQELIEWIDDPDYDQLLGRRRGSLKA